MLPSSAQRRWARGLVLVLLVTALTQLSSVPAHAAPVHDTFPNAKLIKDLPYVDRVDTRGATAGAVGADTCSGNGASVWYRFTPSRTREFVFDAVRSSYSANVVVFARTDGGLRVVNDPCDDRGVTEVELSAGVTYAIMVSDRSGVGGDLVFRARPDIRVAVDPDAEGTVSRASGEATVSGTVTCSRRASDFFVFVELRQRINDTSLAYGDGSSFEETRCSPRSPGRFSIVVSPSPGTPPFGAGNAGLRIVGGGACNELTCGNATESRHLVTLRWVA